MPKRRVKDMAVVGTGVATATEADISQREKDVAETIAQGFSEKQARNMLVAEKEQAGKAEGLAATEAVREAVLKKQAAGQTLPAMPTTTAGTKTSLQEFGDKFAAGVTSNEQFGPFREGAASGLARGAIIPIMGFAQQAFAAYDNLRALTTGSDTTKVKDYRNVFSKANSQMNEEIKLVQAGKDPTEALESMQKMIIANNVLKAQVKGKGIDNLRYWIRDGKDIQIETEINGQILANQYAALLASMQASQLNQLRAANPIVGA